MKWIIATLLITFSSATFAGPNPLKQKMMKSKPVYDCFKIKPKLITNCNDGICMLKYFCEDTKTGQIITDYAACPQKDSSGCPKENSEGLRWCLKDHKDITITHFRPDGTVEKESGTQRGLSK